MPDIPRGDKGYPLGCSNCGGAGCPDCDNRAVVYDEKGRRCARRDCALPLNPAFIAVYCSNECAVVDAGVVPPDPGA